jgi:hypothetical protein
MTSAEQQTRDCLLGWAPLIALVGSDHIYPDEIEEGYDLINGPALTYERGNTDPTYTLDGTLQCSKVQMIVTCWAKTRSSANATALAAVDAMQAQQNEQVSRDAAYEPELEEYAAIVTFDVWELD